MLLNFGRNGLMPGMTKIVTWSVIDESMHVEGMTKLFRQFVKENKDVWNDELKGQLYSIAEKMVELEDGFINLAYGVMNGNEFKQPLLKEDMHTYIRYIADRRLIGLGLKGIFKQKKNPLPWVDEMLTLPSHANFFEQEESSYSKGALTGSWNDVWKQS
jgi:ribonucleoside-diphosphate reductase beta chain